MQDGALRLTAALGSGPQELVKLDLSYCGLSHHDFPKICANISLIGGLLELNLGGNYIGQEVCHFISRMPSHIVGSCVLICVVNSISGSLILCSMYFTQVKKAFKFNEICHHIFPFKDVYPSEAGRFSHFCLDPTIPIIIYGRELLRFCFVFQEEMIV